MQNEYSNTGFNYNQQPSPSWESILSSTVPRRPRNPNDGPITSPGIPEDQVTHLPPPPQTPRTPGPAIPPPRYEDLLSSYSGPALSTDADGIGTASRFRNSANAWTSGWAPFGAYGNSGEAMGQAADGLRSLFGNTSFGNFSGNFSRSRPGPGKSGNEFPLDYNYLPEQYYPYGPRGNGDGSTGGGGGDTGGNDGGDTGGGSGGGTGGGGGGTYDGRYAVGTPYLGRTDVSPSDVAFWNLPSDYQTRYFEQMALRTVGDYDRTEPTYDNYGNLVDPGGKITGGPSTTKITQLMSDMAQTARSQMLSGYMPRVSY